MKKVLLILLSLLGVGLILPLGLFWDNEIFLMIVNMLRGLVAMAILYCAIIWIYFRFRRKADKKYVVEIGTVLSVLALSVAGKVLAIIMKVDDNGNFSVELPKDGWQAVSAIYYSLYQSIGGLSFEGLANYDYYESWRTIVYAGTSVLAGLVAISIITFSFSYEIYSTAAWLTTWKRNRKIYVFTAVTEDSVTLAHSIADHHAKNGQKYLIIFLRTEGQEGFDGKNPLHIDIMHSGFLFRSYSPGRKNKSIPEFLGIKIKNDYCLQKDNVFEKHKKDIEADKIAELHIFALDWEKDKTSENDKLVCEDVARITEKLFEKKLSFSQRWKLLTAGNYEGEDCFNPEFLFRMNRLGMIINYHFLVNEEIDISNVDSRFENEIAKFAPGGEYDKGDEKSKYLRTIGTLAKKVLYDEIEEREKRTKNYAAITANIAEETAKIAEKAEEKAKKAKDKTGDGADKAREDAKKAREQANIAAEAAKEAAAVAKEAAAEIENTKKFRENRKNVFLNYKRHFVFDAINEANMAAFSYVGKREKLIKEYPELYANDVSGDEYRVLVIGFGQNGQQTMKMSYIFAAAGDHTVSDGQYVEERRFGPDTEENKSQADKENQQCIKNLQDSKLVVYKPQAFVAEVYDKNASEVGGLFSIKHPAISVDMPQSTSDQYIYDYVPVKVRLHSESAYSKKILNKLDNLLGSENKEESENKQKDYNLIIIALGDDDSNVNIANAILEDSKHEKLSSDIKKKENWQVIAINLRNKLNYDRINWQEKDEKTFEHIKVIRFGSSEEMYSYDHIVDMSLAKQWNYGYNVIKYEKKEENTEKEQEEGKENKEDEKEVQENKSVEKERTDKPKYVIQKLRKAVNDVVINENDGVKSDSDNTVGELQKEIDINGNKAEAERQWAEAMYYSRTSSRYACKMPAFIKSYCVAQEYCDKGDYANVSIANMVKLGAVEHDRWTRYMVACGFKKGNGKEPYFKEHNYIEEYKYIDSQHNDMLNVLNALMEEPDGEHNDPKKI